GVFCGKIGGVRGMVGGKTTGAVGGAMEGEATWNALAATGTFCCQQTRSNSLAKARTVGKRCCGSFCNAVITTCSISTGNAGRYRRMGGGGFVVCWSAISVNVP